MQQKLQRITRTRGDDWGIVVDISGVDVSTATFRSMARESPDSPESYVFSCVKSGEVVGRVECSLSSTVTQNMSAPMYYWDLEMTNNGAVQTLITLIIVVNKDISHDG